MNPATDTAVTIAEFAVGALGALFFAVPFGIFTAGVALDQQRARQGRLDLLQRLAALVIPPLLLFATFVAAMVLASRADGLTFVYPLIAVPVGFGAWYLALVGLTQWVQQTRIAGPSIEDPQEALRREFAAGTVDTAAKAVTAVTAYLQEAGIDYPTTDLVAEPFEAGWVVSAGPTVFLVSGGGRIERRADPR